MTSLPEDNAPQPLPVTPGDGRLDLEAVRAKLAGKQGPAYWRTLEEVADTQEFQDWMEDEFPNRSSIMEIDRRSLLKFMGASFALAGLTGCRGVFLPEDKIIGYVKAPEEMVPGKPLYYASAMTLAGYATGVLVQQNEGRPTKLEGNPEHPASLGSIDAITQAEILNLYDPDRAQNVLDMGDISSWERFFSTMREVLLGKVATRGRGVAILTQTVTSPTYAALIADFRARFPEAGVHAYEPCGRENVLRGASAAFGRPLEPVYDFSKATTILSLDGDFLSPAAMPGHLRYTRDYTDRRRVLGREGRMNRMYVIESHAGLVGAMADHRYPMKPSAVYGAALEIARRLGVPNLPAGGAVEGRLAQNIDAMVKDLQGNRGQSIIVAGDHHGPELHALSMAMNAALGNLGQTVTLIEPVAASVNYAPIELLANALGQGAVDTLIVMGGNPAYDAPAELKFGELIERAKVSVYHGQTINETAKLCAWNLPGTHPLEAWGDSKAYDGTVSLSQPLVAPLFQGRSEVEVLSTMMGGPSGGYDLVRKQFGQNEALWRKSVHDGVIGAQAVGAPATPAIAALALPEPRPAQGGLEAVFLPDPYVYDGRYSNNGWLQETPRPLTKMTWDNVVTLAVADAQNLGVITDDRVKVTANGATAEGTVYVHPAQPVGSVTLNLGYGRTAGGTLATIGLDNDADLGGGFDVYRMKSGREAMASGLQIEKLGGQRNLASTQGHSPLGGDRIPDNRDVIREATLADFVKGGAPALIKGHSMDPEEIKENNLYPEEIFEWNGNQWGMTIDMNTCVGCNACVTACQAENNISVVGKEQVSRNREMHWIRIDRYYSGTDDNPQVTWQPVACVHCEKAPCEPVCPVAATVHSHEGLNQMVYNRCVGTRYCSNNCPYKVRRFNYLNWSDNQPMFSEQTQKWATRRIPGPLNAEKNQGREMLKMINNPRVTVRGRGVMEKCTYCVQRINEARIEAKKTGRRVGDGEIVTACQQACPAGAIVFGDVADKESRVSKLRADPRSYLLLEELQTRPRTSHLAKLRNPNPEIPA